MTIHEEEMTKLGDTRALVVWAVLVTATVASYLLGAEHAVENADLATGLVMAVACVKVRLVAMHFMEIAEAPLPMRLMIEVYSVGLFALLFALYLVV